MPSRDVDAVIVGGGHNGLVAAAYLARAGLRVQLLERLSHVGGAAVSAQVFDGVEARLSRYAYLVSLLPPRILDDLGAAVRLAPRPYSSYTPDPATAGRTGLLVGRHSTFDAIGAQRRRAGLRRVLSALPAGHRATVADVVGAASHPRAGPCRRSPAAAPRRMRHGGPWSTSRSVRRSLPRWATTWFAVWSRPTR